MILISMSHDPDGLCPRGILRQFGHGGVCRRHKEGQAVRRLLQGGLKFAGEWLKNALTFT